MLKTQKEVIEMICPETMGSDNLENCAGSRCMAWRWLGGYRDKTDAVGYCGKAGKPE